LVTVEAEVGKIPDIAARHLSQLTLGPAAAAVQSRSSRHDALSKVAFAGDASTALMSAEGENVRIAASSSM
jgi:hypothetical protein